LDDDKGLLKEGEMMQKMASGEAFSGALAGGSH